jgi:hypothetical protein
MTAKSLAGNKNVWLPKSPETFVRGIGRRWRQSSGNACLSATQYAYHAIVFILPSTLRGLTAPSGSWVCNSNRYGNFEGALHFNRFLALRSMWYATNSAEPKRIVCLLKYDWQHFLRRKDALFRGHARPIYRDMKEVVPLAHDLGMTQIVKSRIVDYFSVEMLLGFSGVCSTVRQEGGSDAVIGLGAESSGLEMPTRRNTFPITRTIGRIFTSKRSELPLGYAIFNG